MSPVLSGPLHIHQHWRSEPNVDGQENAVERLFVDLAADLALREQQPHHEFVLCSSNSLTKRYDAQGG
eukprot:gene10060-biopygen2928